MTGSSRTGVQVPLRVLIVEDDPQDAALLRAHLEYARSQALALRHVVSLGSAQEVASSEDLDVALIDLGLPDARNLDALHGLREAAPDLPVIVVTARDDQELAAQALYEGAEDYLTKGDFDRNTLIRAIRYAIERRRGRRDLDAMSRQVWEMNQRLETLVLVDPLTELLNRRGIERALDSAMDRLSREQKPHAAFFVDLDRFKEINDRYGHDAGDSALTEVAAKLREASRGGDSIGRVGGDEFVIVMPGASTDEMPRIAERLRLSISSACVVSGEATVRITACVAGLQLTPHISSIDVLLGRMHGLLQQAKQSGKNCVALEGVEGRAAPTSPADSLFRDLRRGQGVFAVIQPIMNLTDLTVGGFELLSRFRGEAPMKPDMVFRMCIERKMLALADHHCLRTCIELSRALPRDVRRHVNIFPSTLMSTPIQTVIDLFPADQRNLFCIELSEQQMLGDTKRLQQRIEELKSAGIRIACDDVGFGRSHLESLVLLEPDVIKLDKRCLAGVARDERPRRHLERFVDVAHKLGAEVIAEGIETTADLEVLRGVGVDQGQGFLWGAPGLEMPIAG
jgi:diguanylate cyclase (GGDEF)-like protein